MSDTSMVDPTAETQETPESTSVADADEYRHRSTGTMYETVETSTRFSTVFADGSHPSSPSVAGETQSAGTPYPPFTKGKETGTRPKAHTPTKSISDVTSSATSKPTAPSSIDEEDSLAHTSEPDHSDVSATSEATQSADVPETPPTISGDPAVKASTARQDMASSYATVNDAVTGTSTLSDVSSTAVASEITDTVSKNEQTPVSATEASSAPSSITDTTKLETAPSSPSSTTSTLPRTDDSHDSKTEKPSGSSFKEERTVSSEDVSTQKPSGGANTVPPSILTTDTATTSIVPQPHGSTGSAAVSRDTTLTEHTSTQTKSANADAASDLTVSSLPTSATTAMTTMTTMTTTTKAVTSPYTDSTDQTGKQTTTLSTETKTTLATSPSKATSETTTTENSYNEEETRRAMCFYDSALLGLGQTDGDIVFQMVKDFCGRPHIDRSMKHGDECIEFYRRDSSKIDYTFEICPNGNCPTYGQNMRNPFGQNGLSCVDIFFRTIWRWCDDMNQRGNGGWWDTTCLEYTLQIGTKGNS
ncbi:hypothetical protein ACKAV7_003659 [Fusarium commune]